MISKPDIDNLVRFFVPGGPPCVLCTGDHHMSTCPHALSPEAKRKYDNALREHAPELALFMVATNN